MFKREKNRIGTKPLWMGITFFLLLGCSPPPGSPPVKVPPSGMVLVQGGTFTMGREEIPDAQPISGVAVASFYLDITEVTGEKYQACITKGDCAMPTAGVKDDPTYNYDRDVGQVVPGKEQHPINGVTFQQAKTYCQVQGKRLPTEIEWEYAARGNTNHKYPWGDKEPGTTQVCWDRIGIGTCPVQGDRATLLGMNRAELDSKNMQGVYDLGGNVFEWVDTRYASSLSTNNTPCTDLTNECVIRGGFWGLAGTNSVFLGSSVRFASNQSTPSQGIGFRCARNEQP